MAAIAVVALVCLAMSGTAALCLFAAGVLAGQLVEGLRHAPRGVGIRLRRRRT